MKTIRILKAAAFIALLTGGILSSCKICRECTEYDHKDNVTDYEEFCSRSKEEVNTWEWNWKSYRLSNNRRIVCVDK